MITVEVANRQSVLRIDPAILRQGIASVLRGEGVRKASVSLAVVDDATIRPLNRRYLQHDDATDVLSFLLDRDGASLEGEVVVSAETAAREAAQYGWSADRELLLYAVHGALHLTGYEDHEVGQQHEMRAKEREYLTQLGCPPPD
ncbi:MAG: rRNA maturation RNase YbeY [Pirellulaceae bacterium]